MSNVIPFDFQSRQVRVVQIQDEPWFVAADVCSILSLSNPTMAIQSLDDDEVTLSSIEGNHRQTNLVNEPGLYSLIFKSRKSAAKKFKRWVTHEVLPAIRKTGRYQVDGVALPDFSNPAEAARAWADQHEQTLRLQSERDEAVSTKALIGSHREATAMARASTETRRANQLQRELGVATDWKAVKAIPWLAEEFALSMSMYQQVGKKLKAISDEMGLKVDEIPNAEYRFIKSYHIDAINELWRRLQEDGELLAKYRKEKAA